jgi:DNA polymerase-3 subunit epsilon
MGEPTPARARPLAAAESRPEYYDFDLFRASGMATALQDRSLGELAFTAFDTETTGLEPSAGDEIISIGAVRIVNGRLLRNEVFEQLVDPRRPLGRESVRVHGIEARALEGQPAIAEVLPAFHRFCEDTVLVAHNAAFDMRFLELKESAAGVRFAQPVLDTLLLSAAVHPAHDDHRLESIAERLGVRVIGRHTALGDALLTGEVFLRLVPLLAERGIVTLGQALEASRETYYARLQY